GRRVIGVRMCALSSECRPSSAGRVASPDVLFSVLVPILQDGNSGTVTPVRQHRAPHPGGEVISLQRWIRVVGTLIVFAPDVLPAQDPSIVAPGAKLERLFDDGFFTEGPTQAPDGSVYFSDITVGKASGYQAGHIWRWDPRTRTTAVFRSPSGMSNVMVFDGQGRLVVEIGRAS